MQAFRSLTLEEKFEALYSRGFYMFRRSYLRHTVVVFSMNGFFAKLTLCKLTDEPRDIRAFTVGELSESYCRQVMKECPPFVSGQVGISGTQGSADQLQLPEVLTAA